jgi:integrase
MGHKGLAMAALKLEDLVIKSLKRRAASEGRRLELRDTIVRGLAIRATPSGELTWTFMFRLKGTRRLRRITLGDYPNMGLGQARATAKDMLGEVRLGADPQAKIREREEAERRPKQQVFGDLYHMWLERYAKPNLRAWRAEDLRYRRNLEKSAGRRPMVELDRKSFADIRDDVASNSGPIESNRTVALINRVLHWAVDAGLIPYNPAARMKKAGKEKALERVLDAGGIRRFWTAVEELDAWKPAKGMGAMGRPISPSIRIALKLMLVTAQRRGEIIGAERNEFHLDGEKPYWIIPGDRTKNGVTHLVPLTRLGKQLVQDALLSSGRSGYLFASSDKDGSIRADAVTRALARLVRYYNRSRPLDQHLPTISPHDLRRTAGTLMAKAGVSKEIRGHVLNHVTGSKTLKSTDVYNVHDYHQEKRDALSKLEDAVTMILNVANLGDPGSRPSRIGAVQNFIA